DHRRAPRAQHVRRLRAAASPLREWRPERGAGRGAPLRRPSPPDRSGRVGFGDEGPALRALLAARHPPISLLPRARRAPLLPDSIGGLRLRAPGQARGHLRPRRPRDPRPHAVPARLGIEPARTGALVRRRGDAHALHRPRPRGLTLPALHRADLAPAGNRARCADLLSREARPAGGPDSGLHALLAGDRKSTRLNSSHVAISYAVFCLKKKIAIVSDPN